MRASSQSTVDMRRTAQAALAAAMRSAPGFWNTMARIAQESIIANAAPQIRHSPESAQDCEDPGPDARMRGGQGPARARSGVADRTGPALPPRPALPDL